MQALQNCCDEVIDFARTTIARKIVRTTIDFTRTTIARKIDVRTTIDFTRTTIARKIDYVRTTIDFTRTTIERQSLKKSTIDYVRTTIDFTRTTIAQKIDVLDFCRIWRSIPGGLGPSTFSRSFPPPHGRTINARN